MPPTTIVSRRFGPAGAEFPVTTEDGIRLLGTRVARRVGPDGPPALVLCHGFFGWHKKPSMVALGLALARWFTVYAFDFRGHGRSGGRCTYGDLEYLDVDAVVRLAAEETGRPLVSLGVSMGGIAVIRHAALRGGVDAVVAVSTPARWDGHGSRALRRIGWMTTTVSGRRLARMLGTRLADAWSDPESPEDLVGRIAPIPLLLVHGRDDHFFEEDEAWRLYRRAGEPKRLLLAKRFGHADDGFNPAFAELVARRIYLGLGLPWEASDGSPPSPSPPDLTERSRWNVSSE